MQVFILFVSIFFSYLLSIKYTPYSNIIYGVITAALAFLTSYKANRHFFKSLDPRMLILSAGFLGGGLFEIMHFSYSWDYNIQFYYIFFENFCYSAAILLSLFPYSALPEIKPRQIAAYSYSIVIGFFAIIILAANIIPLNAFGNRIPYSSMEIVYSAVYLLCAIIFMDIRKSAGYARWCYFSVGLILFSLGELYIIENIYFGSFYRHITHIEPIVGFILIYLGLDDIENKIKCLNIRQKLLIYPALFSFASYMLVDTVMSVMFGVVIPNYIRAFFLIYFLGLVLVQYYLSKKLTASIFNIIDKLNQQKYSDKFLSIPVVSSDEVGLLTKIINEIYQLMYKNTDELKDRKNQIQELRKRDKVFENLVAAIRSSLDMNDIFNIICNELISIMGVDKVFLAQYEKEGTESKWKILAEKNSEDYFCKVEELAKDFSPETNELLNEIFNYQVKDVIIDDINKTDMPEDFVRSHKKFHVQSILGVPIKKDNKAWGVLVLFQFSYARFWKPEEIDFLHKILDQFYITVEQAELYIRTKKQAEIESLLRGIINTTIHAVSVNEILETTSNQIIEMFNIDKVVTYKLVSENSYVIESEFISGSYIKSTLEDGLDERTMAFNIRKIHEEGRLVVNDINEFDAPFYYKNWYRTLGLKSFVIIPIKSADDVWGFFGIGSSEKRKGWDESELSYFQIVADQLYIGIRKIEFYQKMKMQIEREELFRKLIANIRESLDINYIFEVTCYELAKLMDVERVSIMQFPDSQDYSNYILRHEYRSSSVIKGVDANYYDKRAAEYFGQNLLKRDERVVINNIEESETPLFFKQVYQKMGVRAIIGVPIKKNEDKWGTLVVSKYSDYKEWTEEDENLLRIVADQIYISIKQSEMYENARQQAERETIIREITTNIISNVYENQIPQNIVEKIGVQFKADRCAIIFYDKFSHQYSKYPYSVEYLSPDNFKSLIDNENDINRCALFQKMAENQQCLIIDERDEFIEKESLQGTSDENFLYDYAIASGAAIPIFYGGDFKGILLVFFATQKYLSASDRNFLKVLATQIGVAIRQIESFAMAKHQAERERLLRELITNIIGSFDINEILSHFVRGFGQIMEADRVGILIYDSDRQRFSRPDDNTEYLSSADVKSMKDFELTDYEFFNKQFMGGKEVVVQSRKQIVQQEQLEGTADEYFLEKYDIKGGIGMPIIHSGEIIGRLIVHYTKEGHYISDEDLEYVRIFAGQIGIAINQSKLFNAQRQTAEKEKITREIISEIKFSTNLDQIYFRLLEKLSVIFDADRCIFFENSPITSNTFELKAEYIRNTEFFPLNIKNFSEMFFDDINVAINNHKPLIIEDIYQYCPNKARTDEFFTLNNITSAIFMPLIKDNEHPNVFGIIGICSVSKKIWSTYEINLLLTISGAVAAIAMEIDKFVKIDDPRRTYILTLVSEILSPLLSQKNVLESIMSTADDQQLNTVKPLVYELLQENKELSVRLNKLLKIHNYEAGGVKLNLKSYNIFDLIDSSIAPLRELAAQKTMQIRIEIEPETPPVYVDKDEIGTVLHNFVENSVLYTQEGGEIIIRAHFKDFKLFVCVVDNGPGIPEDTQLRLFSRCEVIKSLGKKIGSGLGLYLSKLIVEAHGGHLWYASEAGKGTMLCLWIPQLNNA